MTSVHHRYEIGNETEGVIEHAMSHEQALNNESLKPS